MVRYLDKPVRRGNLDILTATLQSKPPSLIRITQPLALILLPCCNLRISLLVDPRMYCPDDRYNNQIHNQVRQRNGVSDNVSRAVTRSVKLRSNDRTDVADGDLHRIGRCALRLAADIDGWPGKTECNGWIDTSGGEEGTHVGDSGLLSRVCVAEENAVADYGNGCREEDEGTATSVALRDNGIANCEGGRKSL